LKKPEEFSYFQALRLLYRVSGGSWGSFGEFLRYGARIRAGTDLSFPASDLIGAEKIEGPGEGDEGAFYRLTVTFMGLYGAASPLPPFYAREILEEVLDDREGLREFFDLLSYFSYREHARSYFLSSFPLRILEAGDEFALAIIRALLGLPHKSMIDLAGRRFGDLPYLRLFAAKVRHAPGLAAYLSGRLKGADTEIEECVLRTLEIPPSQRAALGGRSAGLGVSAMLGRTAPDLSGKFRLIFQINDMDELQAFSPGGASRALVEDAVERYVDSPLVYDILLNARPGGLRGFSLGEKKRALGISAFLAPGKDLGARIVSPVRRGSGRGRTEGSMKAEGK
jgi:type VI secretion system protein ImpH